MNKKDQNEHKARLWREKRKTIPCPETAGQAIQLSYEAGTMLDWFYANRSDLYVLTYALGLKLSRYDVGSWKSEARYLARKEKKEVTQ